MQIEKAFRTVKPVNRKVREKKSLKFSVIKHFYFWHEYFEDMRDNSMSFNFIFFKEGTSSS